MWWEKAAALLWANVTDEINSARRSCDPFRPSLSVIRSFQVGCKAETCCIILKVNKSFAHKNMVGVKKSLVMRAWGHEARVKNRDNRRLSEQRSTSQAWISLQPWLPKAWDGGGLAGWDPGVCVGEYVEVFNCVGGEQGDLASSELALTKEMPASGIHH